MPPYPLKKSDGFDAQLAAIIPHVEIREEFERGIRFELSHFPLNGKFVQYADYFPIYALPFAATERTPALIVSYAIIPNTDAPEFILMIKVKRTADTGG